jgi:hypothetical protein
MNRSDNRRQFIRTAAIAGITASITPSAIASVFTSSNTISPEYLADARVGMIGLDTSHCEAFAKVLNDPSASKEYSGFPVVAAYPYGSTTIESSAKRIPAITEQMKKMGIRITSSIPELLQQTDVILLETNDGRLHYEQALQVIKAGKRLFIDKPIASTLKDAVAIFEAAKKYKVPVFSSSSLRFTPAVQELAKGSIGKLTGADTYTPCHLEKTHSDLFWYGIHGVETLYTLLGTGCRQVTRIFQEGTDLVVGTWGDGRIGTFRGIRTGKEDYGAVAFGEKGIKQISAYAGYEPLVKEIVQFFRTGVPPVSAEETTEICAFMEAAEESSKKGGIPVDLSSVLQKTKSSGS